MTTDPIDELAELRDRIPFAARLGVEFVEASPSLVVGRLAWASDLSTSDGDSFHGGALMGLADVCAGVCGFLNLPQSASGTTTIESSTHFMRAARGERVEARSEALHTGRSIVVVQTDLTDGTGRCVVRVIQSQAVLHRQQPPSVAGQEPVRG